MSSILMRCRDAEMIGPVCDVLSDERPLDETVKEMRVNAQIHNEPAITDEDVTEMEELLGQENACCGTECCCC